MSKRDLGKRRKQLQQLLDRMEATAHSLDEEVRTSAGRSDGGNLSNVPMHLGDLGSETYTQEVNAALLENSEHLRQETIDALEKIDNGNYGVCERCGVKIPEERLDAVPYTRYCTPCAEVMSSGQPQELNDREPRRWSDTEPAGPRRRASQVSGESAPFTRERPEDHGDDESDRHAVGTPGGGTAVGGLAGTNVGAGDPANVNLEEAMASSEFDVEIEGNDEETDTYSGPAGGAVGGTPAGKRAKGGRKPR